MKKFGQFLVDEIVLCIATVLALISMLWVRPSAEYASYMNWKVLSLLLCLMLVMDGLKQLGVFSSIAKALMKKVNSFAGLVQILVLLCFFSSMFITNDVALITFVPFAIEVLRMAGAEKKMIPVIVLQTVAANLGSMLTPIGNPQNLYLYDEAGLSLAEFIRIMALPCVISLLLLMVCNYLVSGKEKIAYIKNEEKTKTGIREGMLISLYVFLFLLSLLVVAGVLPFTLVLAVTLLAVFIMDRKTLWKADYCLLLTFSAFFIFVGNMGNIEHVAEVLERFMQGREFLTGVLASQVISNVPAALLLSGFTGNYEALLWGVNIGGLGTLIASMASLISFKLFAKAYPKQKGKYLGYFTLLNVIYLVIFVVIYYVVN